MDTPLGNSSGCALPVHSAPTSFSCMDPASARWDRPQHGLPRTPSASSGLQGRRQEEQETWSCCFSAVPLLSLPTQQVSGKNSTMDKKNSGPHSMDCSSAQTLAPLSLSLLPLSVPMAGSQPSPVQSISPTSTDHLLGPSLNPRLGTLLYYW